MNQKQISPPMTSPHYFSFLGNIRYEHLVSGVAGGVTSTVVVHPLDLIKIRFAVNDGQQTSARPVYRGLIHAIKTIIKTDGFLGLYQGLSPNLIGAGAAWGLYFLFYNSIKTGMYGSDFSQPLHAGQHLLAACESGVITLAITNPIWVTKTRLCLQYGLSDLDSRKKYSGVTDALVKIYKYEGVRGLYKGFVPGLFGISHGALQFMVYEQLKIRLNQYRERPHNTKLISIEYLACGALSKMIATATTYPYQVLRARLQDQHTQYNGVFDVFKKTWKLEGYRGFYKGMLPSLLRVTPATAITFLVYEEMLKVLE